MLFCFECFSLLKGDDESGQHKSNYTSYNCNCLGSVRRDTLSKLGYVLTNIRRNLPSDLTTLYWPLTVVTRTLKENISIKSVLYSKLYIIIVICQYNTKLESLKNSKESQNVFWLSLVKWNIIFSMTIIISSDPVGRTVIRKKSNLYFIKWEYFWKQKYNYI